MSSPLTPIVSALFESLYPLVRSVRSPQHFVVFIKELGWELDIDAFSLEDGELATMAFNIKALVDEGESLVNQIAEGDADSAKLTLDLLDISYSAFDLVRSIKNLTPDTMPTIAHAQEIWDSISQDLPDYLLISYLDHNQPVMYSALRLAGIIEEEWQPAGDNLRSAYIRRQFRMDYLGAFIADPMNHLQEVYRWGGLAKADAGETDFDYQRLLENFSLLLAASGATIRRPKIRERFKEAFFAEDREIPADLRELEVPLFSGFIKNTSLYSEIGFLLLPVPATPDGDIDGLLAANLTEGNAQASVEVAEGTHLSISGSLDASGSLGVQLMPSGCEFYTPGEIPPDITAKIAFSCSPAEPWRLLGAETGPRIMANNFDASFGLSGKVSDPNAYVRILTELSVVIEAGEGDSFIQDMLSNIDVQADLSLEILWSGDTGLTFGGSGGLEVIIPIEKQLGPIFLDWAELGLAGSAEDGATLSAAITGSVELGPFSLVIDGIGLAFSVQEDKQVKGTFGSMDLSLGMKPPQGIGLGINSEIISGGGYLRFEPDEKKYSGVANFEFADGLSITAIGILQTQMPDGSKGWSLLLSLSTEFPGIPLGFFFNLNGLGGLIAIHRTMDIPALQKGAKSGAIDSIMFPDDPIEDAPRILNDLESIFPVSKGSFVIGPFARISWGTPKLMFANIGILIKFPDPVTIALIGQIESILPTDEVDIVQVHLEILGTIDFASGLIAIDATLYETRIAGLIVSGEGAFRLRAKDQPLFLLSLGGYHPAFQPPAEFPTLKRLSIALDTGDKVRIQLTCYMAVTSNTFQFGARLQLLAEVSLFTIEGGAEFDVLIQFAPFGLLAHMGFYVAISKGNTTLAGVFLDLDLEGPKPWHALGTATFTFLGLDKSVKVNATIGKKATEDRPALINIREKLIEALSDRENWTEFQITDGRSVVLYESESGESLLINPASLLEVRQKVVPLKEKIDHYGKAVPEDADYFSLSDPKLGKNEVGDSIRDINDWFAPADFFEMSNAEKLSSPSFEKMPAGIRFGGNAVDTGTGKDTVLDYEQIILDPELNYRADGAYQSPAKEVEEELAAVKRKRGKRFAAEAVPLSVSEPAYVVASAKSGQLNTAITAQAVNYNQARLALKAALQQKPKQRGKVTLVPAEECEV